MTKNITLMGGLGNQLFQYARALEFNEDTNLVDLVSPNRRSNLNFPDLLDFRLSANVKVVSQDNSPLHHSKALNFCIRLSSRTGQNVIIRFGAQLFMSLLSLKLDRKVVSFTVAKGLDDLCMTSTKDCFIGYFQNYLMANKVRKCGLELKSDSEVVEEYEKKSLVDRPLIVHYRLTDYLSEESFGVPSSDYYVRAIDSLWSEENHQKIWVFSDDIARARELFPMQYLHHALFVSEPAASTAEIFQIMRFGYGYVIANSSFSWWAAALSRVSNVKVICPEPWFSGSDNPKEITPPDWVKLPKNASQS